MGGELPTVTQLAAQLPSWAPELAFVVYIALASAFLVLERRRPSTTLAWILVIVVVPLLGVLAYLWIGRRPVRQRTRRRRRRPINATEATRQIANLDRPPPELDAPARGLVQLALRAAAAPLRRADSVAFLPAGNVAWRSMEAAIEEAEHHIHAQFYIWRDDEAGRRMTALLARRAAEGIKVRVLIDHLGSLAMPASHFAAMRDAGADTARFGPLPFPRLNSSRGNYRNHRKILSIDDRIGFTGGLNVGTEYLGPPPKNGPQPMEPHWQDLQVRLTGDAVVGLEAIFHEDWLDATGEVIELGAYAMPLGRPFESSEAGGEHAESTDPTRSSGPLVQIIPSGPDVRVSGAIASQFTAAIASAQERCWIATPYFIPDEALTLVLRTAALRGVDLQLLLPGKSDLRVVKAASQSYYDELLEAGCRIHEYPSMLHAKYIVVDDGVAAIGSANMDIRSFYLNYEVTAMFYNPAVTADLASIFLRDREHAREISSAERLALAPLQRIGESTARLLSPLL